MVSTEKLVDGIIKYADEEIMDKLPTTGKWIAGTAIGLASHKIPIVVEQLKVNPVIKMLGVMDDNGNIDTDSLIVAMKQSADKYGNMTVEVPMIGRLTFSSTDIDHLKSYIS